MLAAWFEQWIRRYEHGRWANEKNRRVLPFGWGIEYIGGEAGEPKPREFLDRFSAETLAASDEWFGVPAVGDFRLTESHEARGEAGVLSFTSAIKSPWPANNTVYARWFPARHGGPAVILLAQWNAKWHEQIAVCQWLQMLGISALKISLPYHDRRAVPDHPRADFLVAPNIGLTLQANRQAVCDARACLDWLEARGYDKLGIVGTSVGSALAFITNVHDSRLRAAVHLHASTYFADVLAKGLTTSNVWESLQPRVSLDDLRRYWLPISPYPYIGKLRGTRKKMLVVAGQYDPTFWLELTEEFFAALRANGVAYEARLLPCGHYSLGEPPFSYIAGYRMGRFLTESLA